MEVKVERNEFLDMGCSAGGSLEFGRAWWEVDGVGVDLDAHKVEIARARGYRAEVGDVLNCSDHGGSWQVVQGIHFLEHLPDSASAQAVLRAAARMAADLIYFRQPFFDADEQLASLGLKLFWSDWTGHPNKMVLPKYMDVLDDLVLTGSLSQYVVWALGDVTDSADEALLPLSAPKNELGFDRLRHDDKPSIEAFSFPVVRETVVLGLIDPASRRSAKVAVKMRGAKVLASSMSGDLLQRWFIRAAEQVNSGLFA
jgi:hypothetical protein